MKVKGFSDIFKNFNFSPYCHEIKTKNILTSTVTAVSAPLELQCPPSMMSHTSLQPITGMASDHLGQLFAAT